MAVSYKPLFKLMIDRDIKKGDIGKWKFPFYLLLLCRSFVLKWNVA